MAGPLSHIRVLDLSRVLPSEKPKQAMGAKTAVARGIPYRRLNDESLIQFGHGVHQRRIRAAELSGG